MGFPDSSIVQVVLLCLANTVSNYMYMLRKLVSFPLPNQVVSFAARLVGGMS